MVESISFTDRYGGRAPSWLRGCFHCEAMGCLPPAHDGNMDDTALQAYFDAPFTVCPKCHGTARCSWLVTVARTPRWVLRGVRFAWGQRPNHGFWLNDTTTSRRRQLRITLWSAFGADLRLPMP